MTCQPGLSSFRNCANSFPFNGATPPLHGTHSFSASADIFPAPSYLNHFSTTYGIRRKSELFTRLFFGLWVKVIPTLGAKMAKLLIKSDGFNSKIIELNLGVNRFGRVQGNDFQIEHPTISAKHCEIVLGDGQLIVRDCGSTNGTF